MANTKKLTREQRKTTKRKARRTLKQKWSGLTFKERKEYQKARKDDKKSLTVWLSEKEAERQEKKEPEAKES